MHWYINEELHFPHSSLLLIMILLISCFACIDLSSFIFMKCSHFCIDFYADLPFIEIGIIVVEGDLCFLISTPNHRQISLHVCYLHSYLKFQMNDYCQYCCLFSPDDFKLHWICYFLMILINTLRPVSVFEEIYSFVKLSEKYFELIKIVINNSANLQNLSA